MIRQNLTKIKWLIYIIGLVYIDQLTKYLVRTNFKLYETKQIFPFLALTYTTNTGIVFGWFQTKYANVLFSIVIIVVLVVLIISSKNIVEEFGVVGKISLCLIISGGLGNLIDRIFFGKVIDFIDLQWNYKNIWPIFNLADSYVFVGVWLLVIKYLLKKEK
jgi:signal peptidase II